MNYTTVTNLIWANQEHTAITCQVKFEKFGNPLPFTASLNDSESHSVEIFNRAAGGEFGAIGAYVPPPTPETVTQPTVVGAQTL